MLDRCLATQASYDVVVVGGGIVGLSTARELIIRHPTLKFAVVEKENELCEYKDSHLLLLGLFLHEGSVAYSLKFGCNDTLKGNSSNNLIIITIIIIIIIIILLLLLIIIIIIIIIIL